MNENTSVPAVVIRPHNGLGYGQTGNACRAAGFGWSFWPDGHECDYAYLLSEAELFFPQNPGGRAPGSSGFEVFRSAYIQNEIKHHLALKRAAAQTLVVRSWPTSVPISIIEFPWGLEFVANEFFDLGWRTACPLFGEWELVELGTGFGVTTFRKDMLTFRKVVT